MMMKQLLSATLQAALLSAILLALTPQAHAQGVLYTTQLKTFDDLSPNFDSATNGTLPALSFNLFDGILGDLVSVEIRTFIGFENGLAQIDSEAIDATNVDVEFGTEADFTPNGVPFIRGDFSVIGDDINASLTQNYTNVGGNDGDNVLSFQDDGGFDNRNLPGPATGSPVTNTDNGFIGAPFLSAYLGPGSFTVDYAASTLFNITSPGSISGAFSPGIVDGSVEIIYRYTPIPEPSAPSLLLALTRRQRQVSR
jgi:hypothetical protein